MQQGGGLLRQHGTVTYTTYEYEVDWIKIHHRVNKFFEVVYVVLEDHCSPMADVTSIQYFTVFTVHPLNCPLSEK